MLSSNSNQGLGDPHISGTVPVFKELTLQPPLMIQPSLKAKMLPSATVWAKMWTFLLFCGLSYGAAEINMCAILNGRTLRDMPSSSTMLRPGPPVRYTRHIPLAAQRAPATRQPSEQNMNNSSSPGPPAGNPSFLRTEAKGRHMWSRQAC